jgi:tetratricopeptide (TPR) repeat protein
MLTGALWMLALAACPAKEPPRTAAKEDPSGLTAEQKANLERYEKLAVEIEAKLKARKADEALPLWEQASALAGKIHASAHPLHAKVLALGVRVYTAKGTLDQAARTAEEELAVWKQLLGQGPRALLADSQQRVGFAWFLAGDLPKAGDALSKAVEAWRAVLSGGQAPPAKVPVEELAPPHEPRLGAALHTLGLVAWKRKLAAEARKLLEEAVTIRRKHLPAGHLDALQSMLSLAQVCEILEQDQDAEKLYGELVTTLKQKESPSASFLGSALKNLADVQRRSDKHADAEKSYAEARKVAEGAASFKGKEAYLAQIDAGLGMVFAATKRQDQAVELLKKALAVFEADPKQHASNMVLCQIQLAKIHRDKRKLADARKAADAGVAIARQHLGEGTYAFARALAEVAQIRQAQGARPEAAKLLLGALTVVHKLYGAAHPRTERLREQVEKLYKALRWQKRLETDLPK